MRVALFDTRLAGWLLVVVLAVVVARMARRLGRLVVVLGSGHRKPNRYGGGVPQRPYVCHFSPAGQNGVEPCDHPGIMVETLLETGEISYAWKVRWNT